MTENYFAGPFFSWINQKAENKFFPFYLALFLMLCSVTLALPRFDHFNPKSEYWQVAFLKSRDLTNGLTHYDPRSGLAKKVFRLTVPAIIRLTCQGAKGILLIQYLLGLLTLVTSYLLSLRLLKDPLSSVFVTAGLVFIFFGRAAFYDVEYMTFDGFAYFFLMVAMFSRNALIIFFCCTLAAWTDERGFIALSTILLFHLVEGNTEDKLRFRSLLRINSRTLSVLAAIIGYIGLRLWLTHQYDMHTPTANANLDTLQKTWRFINMGVWTAFEGFWLLFLLIMSIAVKKKDYIFPLIVLPVMVVMTAVAVVVFDITRAVSYMVPIVFVLLLYLYRNCNLNMTRSVLFVCCLICFLSPPIVVCADWTFDCCQQFSIFMGIFAHIMGFHNTQ